MKSKFITIVDNTSETKPLNFSTAYAPVQDLPEQYEGSRTFFPKKPFLNSSDYVVFMHTNCIMEEFFEAVRTTLSWSPLLNKEI